MRLPNHNQSHEGIQDAKHNSYDRVGRHGGSEPNLANQPRIEDGGQPQRFLPMRNGPQSTFRSGKALLCGRVFASNRHCGSNFF